MHNSRIKTAADQSDNITEQTQATAIAAVTHYFFAERHQHKPCHFETLQSPWNTNDCNAKYETAKKIPQCCKKTTKDQPD